MDQSNWIKKRYLSCVMGFSFLAQVGCGPTEEIAKQQLNKQKINVGQEANFLEPAPPVGEQDSVEAKLSRYEGQTAFLNVNPYYYDSEESIDAPMAGNSASHKRVVQESDVFKVGREGQKRLYLLNNMRGLQIVSFEDGKENPKFLGRVRATGNMPTAMYLHPTKDQLYVIENQNLQNWYDHSYNGQTYTEQNGRVLVYDVSNPSQPVITKKVEFRGYLSDSRIVGDVLYIVSSDRRYHYNPIMSSTGTPMGFVHSFSIQDDLKSVQTHELKLPSYNESMNVVDVEQEDSSYKYYLISSSRNNHGWWRSSPSTVEVVDISDPQGLIKPALIAPIAGTSLERSNTFIKDGRLVAVSSYLPADQPNAVTRIAIETFKLQTEGSTLIDRPEAEYRLAHLERELDKLRDVGASVERIERRRTELLNDPELGLVDTFVKSENGSSEKLFSDSRVTIGDTHGLHAQLQDVRIAGDKLYVYWVPANLVDPLDVFDISDVSQGITADHHLAHLEFEGWIERSFPLSYKGKDYILGLGMIIPSINNENGRRIPQARLIELVQRSNGSYKAIDRDDISLEAGQFRAALNGQDKEVELKWDGGDTGSVMFKVSSWNPEYVQGGKIINFDLSKVDSLDVFTEGPLFPSKWGWLRRVFTNPEMDLINTFSDQELRNYEANQGQEIAEAVSTLELARNAAKYLVVDESRSIQVISRYKYQRRGQLAETELRLISSTQPDAELADVISSYVVEGSISLAKKVDQGFLITVARSEYVEADTEGVNYKSYMDVILLGVEGNQVVELSKQTIQSTSKDFETRIYANGTTFIEYDSGEYLLGVNNYVYALEINDNNLSTAEISLDACSPNASGQLMLKQDEFYWTSQQDIGLDGADFVAPPVDPDHNWWRNQAPYFEYSIQKTEVDFSSKTVKCIGEQINVPGKLEAVLAGGAALMDDTRYLGTQERSYERSEGTTITYKSHASEKILSAVVIGSQLATLTDGQEVENSGFSPYRLHGYPGVGWGDSWYPRTTQKQFLSDGSFITLRKSSRSSNAILDRISASASGRILKKSTILPSGSIVGGKIVGVKELDDHALVLIRKSKKLQLIQVNSDQSITPVKIEIVDSAYDQESKASLVKDSPRPFYGSYWWGGYQSSAELVYDEAQNMVVLSEGMYGYLGLKVAE